MYLYHNNIFIFPPTMQEEKKSNLNLPEKKLRIGIDFGGVLTPKGEQYETNKNVVSQMDMPGCIPALQQLKKDGHYLVLISFCGPKRANSTRMQIPLKTYFDEFYFVKNRKYKNDICKARALDVMIDDREDILNTLEFTQKIHFGQKGAETWKDVMKIISRLNSLQLKMDETINIYSLIHK